MTSYVFGNEDQYRWRLAKDSDLPAMTAIVGRPSRATISWRYRFDSDGSGNLQSSAEENWFTAQDYIDFNEEWSGSGQFLRRTIVGTDSDVTNVIGFISFSGHAILDDLDNKTWRCQRIGMGSMPNIDHHSVGRQLMVALKQQQIWPLESFWVLTTLDSANTPNTIQITSSTVRAQRRTKLYSQTKLDQLNYAYLKDNLNYWINVPADHAAKFSHMGSTENFGMLNSLPFIWDTYDSAL